MIRLLPYFLFFLLALEGLGIPNGRELAYAILVLGSPIFFIHTFFQKKAFKIPRTITILFILLIVSAFISSFMGLKPQNSLQYSFLLLSIFFLFLVAYNNQKELTKPIIVVIFLSSALFTLYSALLSFHINFPLPANGYQFVFSKFGSHNHLGDFLVLPSIICLYYLYNRKYVLLAISYQLFAIIFIFFSYSRSAYLSLALTTILLHLMYLKSKNSLHTILLSRLLMLILVLSSAFFIVATTRQAITQPLSKEVNETLVKKGGLKHKELLGNRLEYIRQSLLSVQKNSIFGIGPNNFLLVSKTYAPKKSLITEATHNIFLEILVGQGILGLLPFITINILILIKSKKNALYFGLVALLINFQTDYTYQIYSFLLLFFVLSGVILEQPNHNPNS